MRPLPPLLTLVALTAMVVLRLCAPFAMIIPRPYVGFGLIPAGLGLFLVLGGARQFSRARTNIKTFNEPDVFVTDGLFRWSRNPMYLGFTLLLTGAAVLLGAATPFAVVALFVVITDRWYIAFEERVMQRKFGAAYEAYRRGVRRWI